MKEKMTPPARSLQEEPAKAASSKTKCALEVVRAVPSKHILAYTSHDRAHKQQT